MTTLPIGMLIESLVAVLLLVTIGYCWMLNRRLQRLRADEETLRATISELITATEIAERAILGLKATASEANQSLGTRLTEAEKMSQTLGDQLMEGERVLGRISQIAEAARTAQAKSAADPAPAVNHPEPAAPAAPQRQRGVSASDISLAAAEATARLGRFRKRGGEAVA